MILSGRRGQGFIETVILAPLIFGSCAVFGACLVALVSYVLADDRLEEALLCLSHQPRPVCEARWIRFLEVSGFHRLHPQWKFQISERKIEGEIRWKVTNQAPLQIQRTLRLPLSGNSWSKTGVASR